MIFDNELNKNNILNFPTSGMYGILSENSELMIEYSTCISGTAYTSTFKNGKTQYNYASGNFINYENIIWLNSIVNKDEYTSLIRTPSFYKINLIQIGSYTNIENPKNKDNGGLLDKNDFKFSGYLINDGDKIFWSKFGNNYTNIGQFYKESTINLTTSEFTNLLKKIPKNLNGYNVTFNIIDKETNVFSKSINIDYFYNGQLTIKNINLSGCLYVNNNQSNINFISSTISGNEKFGNTNTGIIYTSTKLDNNKNIIFSDCEFTNNNNTELFIGNNNDIIFKDNIYNLSSYLTNNKGVWYNNNIIFNEPNEIEDISKIISGNREIDKSNIINVNDYSLPVSSNNYLFNHTHNGLYDSISAFVDNSISITDGCYNTLSAITNMLPLTFRGVDVGSIIGWPQYCKINGTISTWLPAIPDGFYNCSIGGDNPTNSFNIPIDINDPTDKYFNGQLALLLSDNINNLTFQIPYIHEIYGLGTKVGTNYNNNHRIVYIIKYNNNFEHNQTSSTIFNRNL